MNTPIAAADDPLQRVATETERYVARSGWDQPARLFAIVPTHELAGSAPDLVIEDRAPEAQSAAEQEGFSEDGDIGAALARIVWPAAVVGAALSVERIVVPPAAEAELPDDPHEALEHLRTHPGRRDVRLLAAVHRDGRAMCLLRQRAYDSDDLVATGPDLAGALVEALAQTLLEDPAS